MQNKLRTQQQLLGHINQQAAIKSPYIVAVDGYAGAGKSTLARWLADQLGAQVITLDDFYRALTAEQTQSLFGEQALQAYFDVPNFANTVLRPLLANRPASWQPIDWLTAQPLALKQVLPKGVIIVEGVFACHKALLPYIDMRIMAVAEPIICQQRVLERQQPDTAWYSHWAMTEDWYHQTNQTQGQVTYIYSSHA